MSQQIRVLQCVNCSLYQVDIVKKTNKWECKVCRSKQILQKEFFRGSGAECRAKVQDLNLKHGQKQQAEDDRKILKGHQNGGDSSTDRQKASTGQLQSQRTKGSSKWADYVDEPTGEISSIPTIQHGMESPKNNLSTRNQESSDKWPAQNEIAVNKKSSSKWQNFL